MNDNTKKAIDQANEMWKRGFLLDKQKVTFDTEFGKVTFKHDGEKLSVTVK